MKYVKMLGLLAVAAAALMAFAGTASATTLTSSGSVYTGEIIASSEGATSLDGAFVTVSCKKSTVEGKVETHGAGVTAGGKINETAEKKGLTFTECNYPTTVNKVGSLEIHATEGGNGTVTSSGAEISIATSVGTCVFTTSNTDVGAFTGGSSPTMDIASAKIPRTGGNFLCGSTGTWTGSYSVTTPANLTVDA